MTINVALVFSGVFGDLLVGVIERDRGFYLAARAEDPISVIPLGEDLEFQAIVLCTPTGSISLASQRLMEGGACGAMVAITPDGKDAWLHAPHRDPRPLPDLSPEWLLTVIRDAVATDGETCDG